MTKVLATVTGSISFSQRGEKGEKGDNGVGVKGFNTYYGLSEDKSTTPTAYDYNTLSGTIIKTNSDMYVWSADKVLYTDGTGGDFINAYCIGKCSDLTSVKEQYGTSTSAGTPPNEWGYTYPSNPANGTYVWSRDEIVWAGDNSTTHSDAQLIGYIAVNGEAGAGMVVAYQQAVSKPTNKPLVTSYETYKNENTNNLQNNWFKSAPSAQRVLVSGGSVPNVSYNENWSIGEWVATSNSGHTWYKSPEVNHGSLSQMRINFTTTADEQYVTFYLKAYSEENHDFVLISEIDSEHISVSDYTERASGNGVEVRARLKCNKAGAHFVCVAYAKDSGVVANGDYGLVRMATNENYVYASTLLYRCDGDVKDGVISWGSIYQAQGDKGDDGVGSVVAYQCDSVLPTRKPSATSYDFYKHNDDLGNKWKKSAPPVIEGLYSGGSISGTVQYNQNLNGDAWTSGVSDGNHTWYQSPASMTNQDKKNGFCSMQVRFTTTVDEQYVTFYLKAYSEEGYDWILLSNIDSSTVSITNYYSHVSGNGKTVKVQIKCGKAGSHFVTVAYSKDGSGDKNGDYVLFRMATSENYVLTKPLLYRCDGDVKDGVISWGSIYQAQGDKGDKGDKGDTGARGTKGAMIREHDGFESGSYKYLSGSGAEEYVDVVYIKNSDNWWQCIITYDDATDSPKLDDGHWKVMNSFKSIATHLLLAENATINMLGTNQINLYNPSGGAMFGSFRVVDNDADYAFWLGGSTGATATTSITRGGKLKSTSAEITGKITATSGQIAGMKISGLALTNEGFNNEAYIVLRNDILNTFAGIGYSITTPETGMNAVARFTNEETKNDLGSTNYAMFIGASGAFDNVAIGISGGYISGLRIKNAYMSSGGSIYSQAIDIPKNAHSVVLAGSGYYRLPQMEKEDDGYIVFVKRITDSGDIHLLSGFARDSKDGFHTSAIYYDRGSATTDLKIESSGDAMILVYHREMTVTINSTTYEGCWIQYKCPRDW